MMSIKTLFKDKGFQSLLLVFPLFFMYLLPQSLKGRLNVTIETVAFSLANISLVIFFLYNWRFTFKNVFNSSWIFLYFLYLIFVNIPFTLTNYDSFTYLNDICVGLSFPVIMLFQKHISIKRLKHPIFKYSVFVLFALITMELLLVDLGILQLGGDKVIIEETDGVIRFSTTVGPPTATAGILFILGACVFTLIETKKWKTIFVFLWLVSVMLTLSRGSFVGVFLFVVYYLFKNYFSRKHLFRSIISVTFFSSCLLFSGVLNPIIERTNVRTQSDNDKFTGRTEFWNKALKLWENSNVIVGRGIGNVQPRSGQNEFSPNYTLPHNSYLLLLSEQGCIGVLLLFCILFHIIKVSYKYSNKDDFVLLLTILLTILNTETMLFFEPFALTFTYFIRLITNKYEKNNY